MAWIPAAIGATGSVLGGALGGSDEKKRRPHMEANANFRTNNPSQYTPFGSVEYKIDDNGTKEYTDDTYGMVQTYTPEMQGLLNAMMGIAGAGPSGFESHMPEGVRGRMESTFGSEVQSPTYTAPEYAFGYDGGPAQPDYGEQNTGDYLTDYDFTKGETTNEELVAQAYQLGHIDRNDYQWFQDLFSETSDNFSGPNATAWASGDSDRMSGMLDGLTATNRNRIERLFSSMYTTSDPDPVTEPDKPPYDQNALTKLVEAMA